MTVIPGTLPSRREATARRIVITAYDGVRVLVHRGTFGKMRAPFFGVQNDEAVRPYAIYCERGFDAGLIEL